MESCTLNYFDYLPDEMIRKIFSYLSLKNIKITRLVCRHFETVANDYLVKISKFVMNTSDCGDVKFASFSRTGLLLQNIEIKKFPVNLIQLIEPYVDTIRNLKINTWSNEIFNLIERMVNLKHLHIFFPREHPQNVYETDIEIIFQRNCNRCDDAKLSNNNVVSEIQTKFGFEIIEIRLTHLISVSINFKKSKLLRLFQTSTSLKSLKLSTYGIILDELLDALSEVDNNIQYLELSQDQLSNRYFQCFINNLSSLRHLIIRGDGVINNQVQIICDNLPKLKEFRLHCSQSLSDNCIVHVAKLKELNIFEIQYCLYLTSRGLIDWIALQSNPNLETLKLAGNFGDKVLIAVTQTFKNLKNLSLDMTITPRKLPLIFDNLSMLKTLRITSFFSSYGTILDYWRYRKCRTNITNLRNLESLTINGLNDIPGTSFDDIANLSTLRHLSLCGYQKITMGGFNKLIEMCPDLETIKFIKCNEFTNNLPDVVYNQCNQKGIRCCI